MKDVNLHKVKNILLDTATQATPQRVFPVQLLESAIRLDWARPPWLTLQRLRISHSRYGSGVGELA